MSPVYRLFVNLSIDNVFRLIWASADLKFQRIDADFQRAHKEFKEELEYARDVYSRKSISSTTLLFKRNKLFTGREPILNDLGKKVAFMPRNQDQSPKSCTLYGKGGMGKTEIALEFAHRMHEEYDHIFWLDCGSTISIDVAFLSFAKHLEVYQENLTLRDNIDVCRSWLTQTG